VSRPGLFSVAPREPLSKDHDVLDEPIQVGVAWVPSLLGHCSAAL
jgi:hypothetical protein